MRFWDYILFISLEEAQMIKILKKLNRRILQKQFNESFLMKWVFLRAIKRNEL